LHSVIASLAHPASDQMAISLASGDLHLELKSRACKHDLVFQIGYKLSIASNRVRVHCRVCAAPVAVVERQTGCRPATKLAVVALIMQYDLQPWYYIQHGLPI
jgi:hypothetical protein